MTITEVAICVFTAFLSFMAGLSLGTAHRPRGGYQPKPGDLGPPPHKGSSGRKP